MILNSYTVSALDYAPEECLAPTAAKAAEAYARDRFTSLPFQLTCAVSDANGLIGYFRCHLDVVVTLTPIAPPACHEYGQ